MNKNIMVTRAALPPIDEYIKEIKSIWDNHWLTNMGIKHNQLEKELKRFLGIPYISLFTNGHMALELLIQAMELSGEVITTPFTFASTTHAIVRNGLIPVFCDIDPYQYTIDANKIESLITEKTSAILPVHVYGNICDVEKIDKIAKKHSLRVIYDAAHAFGVKYKERSIVEYGDASMLSFHATKIFNTIEGGGICFQKPELEKVLYRLKNFGIKNQEEVDGIGANAKMNEFQAAMGLCNLRHMEEQIRRREELVSHYRDRLKFVRGIRLTPLQRDVVHNYAYFPIYVEKEEYGCNRDELALQLETNGIYARKYFYPLTSKFSCYDGRLNPGMTPIAQIVSENILTLPIYADLKLEDVDMICDIIQKGK